MQRRQNFQTIAWFYDLYKRGVLDLDPPYQRRSVWSQAYRDYFIETLLLGYPAPTIFLYEEISPSGSTRYNVVDGKQRLTAIFDFVAGTFPIAENSAIEGLRGRYFQQLDDEMKRGFWGYQFSVEYLPSKEDRLVTEIFDRINRNVARLTPQELRHARLSGEFLQTAEELSDWMQSQTPDFPRIAPQSRRQMKDVELVAQLLLLLELGARGFSQEELDDAFVEREHAWEQRAEVTERFQRTIHTIGTLLDAAECAGLKASRLRNQVDYYSFFAAIDEMRRQETLPPPPAACARLTDFLTRVDTEALRVADEDARRYYDAARSAANDTGARKLRTEILVRKLLG